MERRIASPRLRDDPAARHLIDVLTTASDQLTDAVVYYDFPMFRDSTDELLRSQTMFASRETGLVFFECASGEESLLKVADRLGQLDALAYGRLVRNPRLRLDKRTLKISVATAIFSPGANPVHSKGADSSVLGSDAALKSFIKGLVADPVDDEVWEELISTVEGSAALRKEREKGLDEAPKQSKGAILHSIYSRIASFDQDQRRAAITLVDGPQRIRGIAGSGKTVVLAIKAAHIHLVSPESKILITFWTKSLYDQFKYLVTRFYRQFSDADPDWDQIDILHAWGGRTTGGGVYYNAAVSAGVPPVTLADVKRGSAKPSFSSACEDVLSSRRIRSVYNYALIDEGQDLPPAFYQLCFELTKGGETDRNVIWAYDELQNILDVNVQNVKDTFGVSASGAARMDLARAEQQLSKGLQPHDIVLKRSYRNPAEVIVAAHALGFGIYSGEIVQILENARHWEDLGYELIEGACSAGRPVRIRRPAENSPINISNFPGAGAVLDARKFKSYGEEIDWVIGEIKEFLAGGLRPHDIMVVSLDDRNAKRYFADISELLLEFHVNVNNMSLTSFSTPRFFIEGAVTLSTVYKAKGNEAAAVFVVGIDAIAFDTDQVRGRNKLFAALTRSKAWLRVSGVAGFADKFIDEIDAAKENFPDLVFVYPDPKRVRTIQRDLADRSEKLTKLQRMVEDLGISNLSDAEVAAIIRPGVTRKER